jgi:glycosyltransferase involved in cell wall biosynthesis
MKILILNDHIKMLGGTEKFIYDLMKKLEEQGHTIKLIGEISGENFKSYFSRIYSQRWYKRTTSEIKQFNPDIIHIHNCSRIISVSPIVASLKMKKPCVITIHDANYFKKDKKSIIRALKVFIHKIVIKASNLNIVVPSAFFKSRIKQAFPNKLKVIPNGISIPKKTTNYKKNILFVGRLAPEKGLQTIIKTLNNLKNYKVLVLGEGPLKKELESEYKNIKFFGFKKPDKFYKNTSILVMPSICEESFGLSTAEAQSYGLAVIGSKRGATPELIRHMKTGLLFKPGDEKDFAERLGYLLKNPSEIKRMGKNARAFVKKNFDWNKVIKQYEGVYKETIEEFNKRQNKKMKNKIIIPPKTT